MKKKKQKKVLPINRNVLVGKSSIHGHGVFLRRPIKKGETAFVIEGKVIKWNVVDQTTSLAGAHWIGYGKGKWIDATGFGRYLNHSPKPSCGIKGARRVVAMRNLKKGDEVTINYSITEADLLWYMKDRSTKKKIRSIQHMTPTEFKKHLPYVPDYFQRVYRLHHKR